MTVFLPRWMFRLTVVGLAFAPVTGCTTRYPRAAETQPPPSAGRPVTLGPVGVLVPPAVQVNEQQRIDFTIYTFSTAADSAATLLSAYVGGHPDFPADAPSGTAVTTEVIDCCTIRTAVWRTDRGTSRQSLVTPKQPDARGTKVHFWYGELGSSSAAMADSLIATIQRLH